jgi:hypothetical protein
MKCVPAAPGEKHKRCCGGARVERVPKPRAFRSGSRASAGFELINLEAPFGEAPPS